MHSKRLRNRFAEEHGQSAVEFGLTIPLIVILVLFFLGAGKALFYWNNATQVANEGARLVAVNATNFPGGASFEDYLEGQVITLGSSDPATIGLEFISVDGIPARQPGSAATVYVCRTYRIPFFSDLTIRGTATMRLERKVPLLAASGGTC